MRSAPLPPYKPTEPIKEFETEGFNSFYSTTSYEGTAFKFSDVKFPEGINLSDVVVHVSTEYEYDESQICVSLGLNEKKIIKNNSYASQLKYYKKQMKEYEVKQAKYIEDKKKYDVELRQLEEKEKEKKIQQAKKMLKGLGFKVVKMNADEKE